MPGIMRAGGALKSRQLLHASGSIATTLDYTADGVFDSTLWNKFEVVVNNAASVGAAISSNLILRSGGADVVSIAVSLTNAGPRVTAQCFWYRTSVGIWYPVSIRSHNGTTGNILTAAICASEFDGIRMNHATTQWFADGGISVWGHRE